MIDTRRFALVFAVTLLAMTPDAALSQWWKEPPRTRLDQRIVDRDITARLKWDDGYIEVKAGATADRALALNPTHERALALDAARQLAYFKLAEIVEGVTIDGVTVVKNAMVADQTVRSTVQAHIKGAALVSESVRSLEGGGVWAEVVLGLRLRGAGSVTDALAAWTRARPADVYDGDRQFHVSDHYTGLIIDASDAGFSPALAPRLLEEGTGKLVFGPHLEQPATVSQQGVIGYAPAMSEARLAARAGGNPLIVRAIASAGAQRGDLIISGRDAERALAADRDAGFFARGAVVVVLGKDRRELAGGKRYALVIGVDDYSPGSGGASNPLRFATRDAEALARALARGGIGVDGLTVLTAGNATREAVLAALRALRTRVQDEDSLVVFFAGHGSAGIADDGRPHFFLVPHDGRLDELAKTALMDDVLEELVGQIPARQVVVLLDTCYAGGGGGVIRARGLTSNATAAPGARSLVEATAGRVVISAARPDQLAFEDDQRRGGLFTSFVLEGLAGAADLNGDGAVTALELFQFVSPRVRERSRQQFHVEQTPVLEVRGLSGEVTLARRP
jgi:Caspase domain